MLGIGVADGHMLGTFSGECSLEVLSPAVMQTSSAACALGSSPYLSIVRTQIGRQAAKEITIAGRRGIKNLILILVTQPENRKTFYNNSIT